ncbi:MAG: helix-turn-helix domain-containing protein [Clostridiales bacterium]|nr:helix-turn-helix domain-containing protein [Clostridiales bacterium]
MIITPTPENVAFFGALASDVRLKIIQLLSKEELNIKELADRIGVSSPIMLKHVQTLENAGVVTSRLVKRNGSTSRVCTLVFAEYRFLIESRRLDLPSVYTVSMPVGHYFDIEGAPTCGLATEKNVIGFRDDPRVFWEPDRVNAQLLWFTQGFVEYKMPNYLSGDQKVVEIELSFEISSEAPDYADDWPSDITFYVNGVALFTWTSPGDYGVKRGVLTPDWWPSNQYGLLKVIHITPEGAFMDDEKMSDVTLAGVLAQIEQFWSVRFAVKADAKNVGGLSLYGKQFGNHAQDIVMRIFYEKAHQSLD